MITSHAKKVAVVAGIYCFCAVGIVVVAAYITEQNKNKFTAAKNSHAQVQAADELSTIVEQTVRLSEADRSELASYFISERDTIYFITRVEELAQMLRVSAETTQLAVVPAKDDEPSRLEIGFEIAGSYSSVVQMLSAIETLPYHKTIPTVSIKMTDNGSWEGVIALEVTLQ